MSHTEQMREALLKQADRQENLSCNAAVAHESAQLMRKAAAALTQPAPPASQEQAQQPSEDVRELSKWLNEETSAPINRQALARVLAVAQQPSGGEVVQWQTRLCTLAADRALEAAAVECDKYDSLRVDGAGETIRAMKEHQ